MRIQALLLPAIVRERPSIAFRALRIALVVLPFVAFAWIGVRWVNTTRRDEALEARLQPLRKERDAALARINALIVPAADAARVEASVAALNATTSAGAGGVLAVLPALERELPPAVALQTLAARLQSGAVHVALKGGAPGAADVAQLADRVGKVAGVRLRSWAARPDGVLDWTAEGDLPAVAK